ncbi:hypothetical protein BDV18DRAFT_135386 [Aspergillus unguis]
MAFPPVDLPGTDSWQQHAQTIRVSNADASITVRIPQVLTQREPIPIYIKSDTPGLNLTNLKVRMYIAYAVRARNVFFLAKSTTCTDRIELAIMENTTPLQTEYIRFRANTLPEVPLAFMALNVACLSHWMEVKYRVAAPGAKEVKDVVRMPVRVQSWTIGEQAVHGKLQEGGGQVFKEAEYHS